MKLEHIGFPRFSPGHVIMSFVRILDFLLQRFEAANDGMDLREAMDHISGIPKVGGIPRPPNDGQNVPVVFFSFKAKCPHYGILLV